MSTRKQPDPVDQEYQRIESFINDLFPPVEQLIYVVPPEVQQAELDTLRLGRRAEQLYFVVDLTSMSIIAAGGLQEIGYNSDSFTFRHYLSTIPSQGMLQLITLLGKLTFMMSAASDKPLVSFLNPKFIANVPITRADGQVVLVKRTISPWQYTQEGYITAYLSEMTILKPFENEPVMPRFINIPPNVEAEFNSMMAKLFANLPAKVNLFSPKQMVLLRLYVENEDELSAKELASLAGITVHTAHTHNRNILMKAKTMFGKSLQAKTARDVAIFLKRCGMLG
ncbi:helix-turn-helix transcriptional regulator [Spirosoma montaniterrae]|uniref:HTH luxR-type domain-containing protein n=1 Tax=Spirosoma montaniterrae TaxID=1178516 RepID=A0A1P9WXZ2_9BACT|nr:hypothetical protein [Spirosoma montaniterrae]AQG80239.1 hypothetical protein AWR27_13475 [Spirosoma montaniterrae]